MLLCIWVFVICITEGKKKIHFFGYLHTIFFNYKFNHLHLHLSANTSSSLSFFLQIHFHLHLHFSLSPNTSSPSSSYLSLSFSLASSSSKMVKNRKLHTFSFFFFFFFLSLSFFLCKTPSESQTLTLPSQIMEAQAVDKTGFHFQPSNHYMNRWTVRTLKQLTILYVHLSTRTKIKCWFKLCFIWFYLVWISNFRMIVCFVFFFKKYIIYT